jgi:plasmid stabilization system protein ParE
VNVVWTREAQADCEDALGYTARHFPSKYRVFYTVERDSVRILHFRHTARGEA